jgi:hypothetical protein
VAGKGSVFSDAVVRVVVYLLRRCNRLIADWWNSCQSGWHQYVHAISTGEDLREEGRPSTKNALIRTGFYKVWFELQVVAVGGSIAKAAKLICACFARVYGIARRLP